MTDDDNDMEPVGEMDRQLPGMDDMERCVYLVGDMGHSCIEHLASALDYLVRSDPDERITVRISSPGGYAGVGLTLYDLMHTCQCPVDTELLDVCSSTAVSAYMAGERRLVHPHSTMMIHASRLEGQGTRATLSLEQASLLWYDERATDLLTRHTGQDRALWWAMMEDGRNHYLHGAQELLDLGLATDLV